MGECLFLCHRLPYPPNKGDKIRAYAWLRALAERHRVHLGAFVDDPTDWAHRQALGPLCRQLCLRPLPRLRAKVRSLSGFWQNESLSFGYYRDRGMACFVRRTMAEYPIDRILVYSSTMGPYVEHLSGVRRIIDFVDVDSDKWRQYARAKHGPMRWMYAREARRLAAGERRLAGAFDASIFVSSAETDLFAQTMPKLGARLQAIDNGVDIDYFDPARCADRAVDYNSIVFTGTMDYAPNVDAVTWFVESILPQVRVVCPAATFSIVGARPSPAVRVLARVPGVTVVGAVDDMRPYLAGAGVAVAPMRIARGVQNKVLEALAMARPVVMTPAAQQGLETPPTEAAAVAEQPGDFAARVVDMLTPSRARDVAVAARRYVTEHYRWSTRADALLELLEGGALHTAGSQAA